MIKDNIIIYRQKLLLPSEGFIPSNYIGFNKLKPNFIANYLGWNIDSLKYQSFLIGNNLKSNILFKFNGYIEDSLSDKILKLKPKLIHAHFGKNGALILPFAKKNNLPLFVTFHGGDATKFNHLKKSYLKIYNRRKKNLIDYASKFICVSKYIADALSNQNFPDEKIVVNYNGIKINSNNLIPNINKELPLLFVGRLVEKKGVETLIRSINFLNQNEYKSIKLNIVGDGIEINKLKNLAKNKNINFLGWKKKDEIRKIMANSSALVVPSQKAKNGDCEGLPTTLLEGIEFGLPIIATKHSGINEIIEDNVSGFLCEENNPIALADCIKKFINSKNLKEMVIESQKRLNMNFDALKQSKKLEEVFINHSKS